MSSLRKIASSSDLFCVMDDNSLECYGSGHGSPEKSTGPPSPASASKRLIITAIAASSLPSDGSGLGDSFIVVLPIISIMSSSGGTPEK